MHGLQEGKQSTVAEIQMAFVGKLVECADCAESVCFVEGTVTKSVSLKSCLHVLFKNVYKQNS